MVLIFAKTKRLAVNAGEVPQGKETYQWETKQFATLGSGEVVAPILIVKRNRFTGFMGAVRTEEVLSYTFHYYLPNHIEIPIADEIREHIFVVRRVHKGKKLANDSWRYWKCSPG